MSNSKAAAPRPPPKQPATEARQEKEKNRAARREAKDADAAARRHQARRGLREDFLSWDAAQRTEPTMPPPPGFDRIADRGWHELVLAALGRKSIHAVFDALADALGCDRSAIVLIERRGISRKGRKITAALLRFPYDAGFIDALREHPSAAFHPQTKTWALEIPWMDREDVSRRDALLSKKFAWIIDVDSMGIYKNTSEMLCVDPLVAFHAMPFMLELNLSRLIELALQTYNRADVKDLRVNACLHDGQRFVPVTDQGTIFTAQPFVLLRVAPSGARPRQVAISSLGLQVEVATWLGSKDAARQTARFMDAIRHSLVPAYELVCAPEWAEGCGDRPAYRGEFSAYFALVEDLESKVDNLGLSLLLSDYVFMTMPGSGAEEGRDSMAYVLTGNERLSAYLCGIAGFFGDEAAQRPVVFTREGLEDIASSSAPAGDFSLVLLHETAHHLANELLSTMAWRAGPEGNDLLSDNHGVLWWACLCVLFAYSGLPCELLLDEFEMYHPEELDLADAVLDEATGIAELLKEQERVCVLDVQSAALLSVWSAVEWMVEEADAASPRVVSLLEFVHQLRKGQLSAVGNGG